ncbi:uncharacterized protein LOC116617331 [Nematostella vectensis]|uniref:uncharacterized protein LOC116617331 n=1 Tax=Nematostella vectensis TaxID=45351 RepID=UPI0020770E2C|nr:uncharacterized protein LOC116617331 [Nematostella vectensis]
MICAKDCHAPSSTHASQVGGRIWEVHRGERNVKEMYLGWFRKSHPLFTSKSDTNRDSDGDIVHPLPRVKRMLYQKPFVCRMWYRDVEEGGGVKAINHAHRRYL